MGGVLTFAEVRDGRLRRPSLEAVSEARRLADALATRVETVLLG
jgi:electron transfer flavoprotein alpha subunit